MTEENITCSVCNGVKNIPGIGSMPMLCPECNGAGTVIKPKAAEAILPKTKKRAKVGATKDSSHAR